ncbi:MAG TPA: signal peptidase I [Bacilli bacterium]
MEKTKSKFTPKNVLLIIANVIFYALILLLLLFAIANIKAKSVDDIPNIFGMGFLSVQSDSMNGDYEDSFKKGDLIFVNILSDKEKENLKVGDIITYYDMELKSFNTHRIVEVQGDFYITQGDLAAKNPATKYVPGGKNDPNTYELVSKNQVKSIYVSHWSGAGKTYDFIIGHFEWTIVLPVALIVILEVFLLVRNVIRLNQEKLKEKYGKATLDNLDEETREKLRRELLEELKKEQEKSN